MQETKYFFEGVPLAQYCSEHGINAETVRTRIWKKRKDSKYSHLSDQEIVDLAVRATGTGTKYFYKGISLRKYCLENGINFGTISSRIKALKRKDNNLSDDEAVRMAIEEFNNKNFTLFYHGKPLKEYILEHPEINYSTIKGYILREREKDSSRSVEEIIDEYLEKEHFGIYKYYYCGIPLVVYCNDKGISYEAVMSRIRRLKEKDKTLSVDDLVNMVMDSFEAFSPKYMYKGISLSEYCKKNDISYYSVLSFVKRRLVKDSGLDVDTLIDEAIKTIKKNGIIYYYQGVPLIDYASENGLNVSSIRASIIRKKGKSNLPLQEIVNTCVETYESFKIKYFYEGESLYSFCKRKGIDYSSVVRRYILYYEDRSDISKEDAIKEIVHYYLYNGSRHSKYFFGEDTLASYCRKNGYSYAAIYQRLKSLEEKYIYDTQDEAVYDAVSEYLKSYNIKKIRESFELLDTASEIDFMTLKNICSILKIDFECVNDLLGMDFNYKQVINLIWYFGDGTLDNGDKYISDAGIQEVFLLVDEIEKGRMLSFKDLVGLYKSDILDTREKILELYKDDISKYFKKVSSGVGECQEELRLLFFIALDKIIFNDGEQMEKYFWATYRRLFLKYIKDLKGKNNSFNLKKV